MFQNWKTERNYDILEQTSTRIIRQGELSEELRKLYHYVLQIITVLVF